MVPVVDVVDVVVVALVLVRVVVLERVHKTPEIIRMVITVVLVGTFVLKN